MGGEKKTKILKSEREANGGLGEEMRKEMKVEWFKEFWEESAKLNWGADGMGFEKKTESREVENVWNDSWFISFELKFYM